MERSESRQFHIQSLMWIVGVIACALGVYRWLGPLLFPVITSPLVVFPVALLVERLWSTSPPSPPPTQPSSSGSAVNLVALMACASLSVVAAGCGCGVLGPAPPWPLFVVVFWLVPDLLESAMGMGGGESEFAVWLWVVALVAFGTFLLMNLYQLRGAEPAPLRLRFSALLSAATAFSALWFVWRWKYGVQYQGLAYTQSSLAINVRSLAVLWIWWYLIRRMASNAQALAFATLLHCWLFWFAFPYLGETP